MDTEIPILEAALLGHIFNEPLLYKNNQQFFTDELISSGTNAKKLYDAFRKIIADGEHPDFISLSETSEVDLEDVITYFTNIDYRFEFRNTLQSLIDNKLRKDFINQVNGALFDLSRKENIYMVIEGLKQFINSTNEKVTYQMTSISEAHKELMQSVERRMKGEITGLKTGLTQFDNHTGGLQPSDLIIVAGETSQGKTSLALTIAYNASIAYNGRIGIFSLEMSRPQLTARLCAIESGISSKKILFYPINKYEMDALNNLTKLPSAGIYIDDCKSSGIDYMVNAIRVAKLQNNIDVAIVDYLQLIKDGTKKTDESEIASNTRTLKNLAKELDITIILLSQFSRDKHNPKPTLARLRGSGQIEEAADLVLLIWRPEHYGIMQYEDDILPNTAGTAELIVAKGRNYGVARMYLEFNSQLTYFKNINYDTDRQVPATAADIPF